MFSPALKTRLATALTGAALASALAVSGASANYGQQTPDAKYVPPPPSSIAVSAADEYQDLRSPDAVDAARAAGNPPEATIPQAGPYPVSKDYQDLRAPDTVDAAAGYQPTLAEPPLADEPSEPSGFDVVSAAVGAIAAGALSLVLIALLGMRRPPRDRPASA
jgi:hypothetical protein